MSECGWVQTCDAPEDDHRHSEPADMHPGLYNHPFIRSANRPAARVAVDKVTCSCGCHFLPAPRPPEPDRTAGLVEGVDAAVYLVQQSLDTVRGEDDGESRSIKVSIAAREHVIGLLAAYRERLATQPRKPTRPLNEWEEWKRECWAAADVAALAPTPDEAP
jgi:hypothetical protein